MSRREDEKTVRRHLMLYEDDWLFLREHFADTAGISLVVRKIVRNYVKALKGKMDDGSETPTVEGPDL